MSLLHRVELKVKLLLVGVLYLAGTAPLHAQAPTASPDSVLTSISVSEDRGALAITLSGQTVPIRPKISRLSKPDRLVFDFAGVLPEAGITTTKVGTHSVTAVRAAIFGNDARGRPITRVVLDLEKPVAYETRNEPGRFVVVVRDSANTLPAASSLARTVPPPRPKAAAPSPELSTVAGGNRLTSVDFGDSSVTLTFASAVAPRKSTLHEPERFVLDFPGVVAGLPSTKSVPDTLRSSLTGIRMAQFRDDPPVYRIVFDQPSSSVSSQLAVEDNHVTVEFGLSPANSGVVPKNELPTVSRRISRSSERPSSSSAKSSAASTRDTTVPRKTTVNSPRGPKVDYVNGLLRIEATNANLADVLYAVGEKTGAAIDMPFSDSMLDQVTFTMGPGKPRDVLATILEGSGFNYYIVENSAGALEKIILIPKQQ